MEPEAKGMSAARRLLFATAVLSVAASGCTGVGLSKRVTTAAPRRSSPAGAFPTPSEPSGGTDSEVLKQVGLQPDEVQSVFVVTTISGGDLVEGQITLDLCAATFPSEALRRARLQVEAVDDSGIGLGVSSEAVLYKDGAATEQGFQELRRAKATCPATFVQGETEGVPPLKYTFDPPPDAAWADVPGVTRLAFAFTLTDMQDQSADAVTVFLRRGRLLVGVYAFGEAVGIVLAPDVGGVEGLVERVARRMAAVPSSVVSVSA
jgi:hypothetical protein